MRISEAVSMKLLKICKDNQMSVNKLAMICCLTQSTVQNLIECNSKNPKLLTIVRICDGLNMSLEEFFNDEIFLNIDRED